VPLRERRQQLPGILQRPLVLGHEAHQCRHQALGKLVAVRLLALPLPLPCQGSPAGAPASLELPGLVVHLCAVRAAVILLLVVVLVVVVAGVVGLLVILSF